ncbi:MAG TPA: viroplasmin family protein [Candidatus Mediterraneibacter norwichensis]|nr:viroplasmin family protein [Candidatus Mediterraneibacter norwichensis]
MKNKPYVFISYRTEYSWEQAETLRGILQAEGIETWKAPEDIPAGEDYLSVFTKAIEECACFAVLMSDAIQEDPGWSRKEIEYAINLEKSARFRIIPVMLDDVPLRGVMRMMLGGYQSVTVSELKKDDRGIRKLVHDIRDIMAAAGSSGASDMGNSGSCGASDMGNSGSSAASDTENPGSSAASDTERSKVYYAVRRGRKPGIYRTYAECEKQVSGFSHQEYKKFSSREAAEEYMQEKENKAWAFVLGDYNSDTGVYGYGGFLCDGERDYPLSGCANDPDIRTMRADAGKLLGIMAAVRKAEELGIQELTIRYDLTGIEKWATGEWKAGRPGTKAYAEFMNSDERRVRLNFEWVKSGADTERKRKASALAGKAAGRN